MEEVWLMGIPIIITVKDSPDRISNNILQECKKHMDSAIKASTNAVFLKTQQLVSGLIRACPEYSSIIDGSIRDIFLLDSPTTVMNDVIKTITDNIKVDVRTTRIYAGALTGGFEVKILSKDYRDILNVNGTSFSTANGLYIPWMDWLLTGGDAVFIPGGELLRIRNGSVIVVGSKTGLRILPSETGTSTNNFLTRAMANIESDLTNIVQTEVERRI
jgi:hypothetical protein